MVESMVTTVRQGGRESRDRVDMQHARMQIWRAGLAGMKDPLTLSAGKESFGVLRRIFRLLSLA